MTREKDHNLRRRLELEHSLDSLNGILIKQTRSAQDPNSQLTHDQKPEASNADDGQYFDDISTLIDSVDVYPEFDSDQVSQRILKTVESVIHRRLGSHFHPDLSSEILTEIKHILNDQNNDY